jgi:MFS family permease
MSQPTEPIPTRRLVYALLIVIAAGSLAGRILAIERVYEPSVSRPADVVNGWRLEWPSKLPPPTPTFSSNDRSRWATVRALVDDGHYWIGERDESGKDHGFVFEAYDWLTIDKVLDPKSGKYFYSSKPPLLPTIMAGEYWLLKKLFGWEISKQKWQVVYAGLFTFQWLPLVIYFILLARLVERYGATDWGRLFVLAAGCFATMPTLFTITFNNHTIAACSALFALYAALRLDPQTHGRQPVGFAVAGFFAGFTACCELPATALAAALFVLLLLRSPMQTLLFFLPAALVPVAAFFITNYLAVGEWLPIQSKFETAWYQFEGSPWKWDDSKLNSNIDSLREPKPVYAINLLLGHHGFFSLSPIWFLALAGMLISATQVLRRGLVQVALGKQERDDLSVVSVLALVVGAAVIGFYVYKTNNYGGWTNGPRWLMWLTPLWLLSLLPVADRLAARRWTRALGYILLAFSILSVSYRDWNPWRHPWVYNFLESHGWLGY